MTGKKLSRNFVADDRESGWNVHKIFKREIVMKGKALIIFLLICGTCWTSAASAQWHSSNTHYQAMHIRQMAKRNFTNKGTVKYVYTDKAGFSADGTRTVGSVNLDDNSRAREVNIAVDLSKTNLRPNYHAHRKLSVGSVTGATRHLKKVNVVIHGNRKLKY